MVNVLIFSYNVLLTVNATSGTASCCWWLCSLVDGKLQKKLHS